MTPHQALTIGEANRRALLARHRSLMSARATAPWRAVMAGLPLDVADRAAGFADAIADLPREPAGRDPLSYFSGYAAGLLAGRR